MDTEIIPYLRDALRFSEKFEIISSPPKSDNFTEPEIYWCASQLLHIPLGVIPISEFTLLVNRSNIFF